MKFNHRPKFGFRISASDVLAIFICGLATWFALPHVGDFAWLFPFVLGHFFLFCNIFRIPRNLELIWAGTFLVTFVTATVLDWGWVGIASVQLPITAIVLIVACQLPSYHGIFARHKTVTDETSDE